MINIQNIAIKFMAAI